MKDLNPSQMKFVAEYVKHGNATAAALEAGYSPHSAKNTGWNLLNQNPAVAAAIQNARDAAAKTAQFNLEQAVAEVDGLIQEAREAKQFSAVSSLFQTKAKLFGLLDERLRVEYVDLNSAMDEAFRRAISVSCALAGTALLEAEDPLQELLS